jgi:hypothetical protein
MRLCVCVCVEFFSQQIVCICPKIRTYTDDIDLGREFRLGSDRPDLALTATLKKAVRRSYRFSAELEMQTATAAVMRLWWPKPKHRTVPYAPA